MGSKDEAVSFALRCKLFWDCIPGLLEWLRAQQRLCGNTPDDNGTILFHLLQKANIMVHLKNTDQVMELTTQVDRMPGTAIPDFYLAPGMKQHNPAKIVAFNQQMAYNSETSSTQRFVSFPYDDVASVHSGRFSKHRMHLKRFKTIIPVDFAGSQQLCVVRLAISCGTVHNNAKRRTGMGNRN